MVAPVCPTNERLNSRRRRNGKGFPPHRAGWPVPPSRADRRRPGASRGARAGRATSEDRREPRVAQHSSPLNEVRGARGVPPWVCRHAAEMKCRELGRQFVPAGRDWRSPAPASWRRGAAGDGPTDAPTRQSIGMPTVIGPSAPATPCRGRPPAPTPAPERPRPQQDDGREHFLAEFLLDRAEPSGVGLGAAGPAGALG
jgi:hypothetical protein